MNKIVLALLLVATLCSLTNARAVDSHLSANDLTRLQKVFIDGLASTDLQSIYYATLNIQATNAGDKQAICSKLRTLHEESKLNEFEKDLYYVGAHKNLQCSEKLPETFLTKIYAAFKSEMTSAQEIYYRVKTQKLLGVQIDEAAIAKIVKVLQELLKKDDSLTNLAYSFNVAADLGSQSAAFVAERVEDAIVQADEVDGKMLQFEGGLSITALVVNGAFKVTKAYARPTPISGEQATKLATYFLSRRSVQTAKGAHVLIEALKTLSAAGKIAPICIQLIGNGQLETEDPTLNIAITDLLGKAVTPAPQNVYGKILLKKDGAVLAEKLQFVSKSSDKTVFTAQLSTYKPVRGVYSAEITADSVYTQKLQFKILGRVKVVSLEIGVAESDASTVMKKHVANFPNTLKETLEADHTQKLVLKTSLVDERTSKPLTVHQAFVRLFNKANEKEIIFVAEQDSSKAYKFDMDVGARGADFEHKSGLYDVYLIIGDAALSNSFQWHVASIQLKFAQEAKDEKKQPQRAVLPEIVHQFRAPEKRPPRLVSDVFTGLCLTPLVLLFLFWGKLGINVSNFSFAPSTIGFHLGFGGILALFVVFWLQLNMFQTLRYLIPLAVFTFLCGNRLLRRIYAQRVGATVSS